MPKVVRIDWFLVTDSRKYIIYHNIDFFNGNLFSFLNFDNIILSSFF